MALIREWLHLIVKDPFKTFGAGVLAGIAVIVSIMGLTDTRSLMKIETLENLYTLTQQVLGDASVACTPEGNLQGLWLERFDAMIDVVGDQPTPCPRRIDLPGPVEHLVITTSKGWDSVDEFRNDPDRGLMLQIGGKTGMVPIDDETADRLIEALRDD